MSEEKKKEGKNWTETVLLVVVFAVVFAAMFFLSKGAGQKETTIDGLRIIFAGNAKEELAGALASHTIVVEERLVNASDPRNSAVAVMAAEAAHSLYVSNKTVYVYGVVDGVPTINCNANTTNCTGAQVVVEISNCDCVRVSDRIYVSGGTDFMLRNAQKVGSLFAYVLSEN
ncbi:Uncharacterised protein [Candidatus Norongarragalina meridionalis]|nr:Uncharacterised protein [Candidatus Norongarragalina meridionalis]